MQGSISTSEDKVQLLIFEGKKLKIQKVRNLQRGDARKKICARARSAQAISRARAQRARARTNFRPARARVARKKSCAHARKNFHAAPRKIIHFSNLNNNYVQNIR